MNEAQKLERFLNELSRDPHFGGYVSMVSSHITSIVRQIGGPAKAWEGLLRLARRVGEIDEEVQVGPPAA